MNVIQPVSQGFPQTTIQNPKRVSQPPRTQVVPENKPVGMPTQQSYPYQQPPQTSKPKPTQITLPNFNQPLNQPTNYQQSTYQQPSQPTFQPTYRPTYQPKANSSSFKIDLGQIRDSYNDSYTAPPVDTYSSQTIPKDPYSSYNATKNYGHEPKPTTGSNMSIESRNANPYGSETTQKPFPVDDRLFETLAKELRTEEVKPTSSIWNPDEFASTYNPNVPSGTDSRGMQQETSLNKADSGFMYEGELNFDFLPPDLNQDFPMDPFSMSSEPIKHEPIKQAEPVPEKSFFEQPKIEQPKPAETKINLSMPVEPKKIEQTIPTPAPYDPFKAEPKKEEFQTFLPAVKETNVLPQPQSQPKSQGSSIAGGMIADTSNKAPAEKKFGIDDKVKPKTTVPLNRSIWEKSTAEDNKPSKEPILAREIPKETTPISQPIKQQTSDKSLSDDKDESIMNYSIKKIEKKVDPNQKPTTMSVKPPIKAFQSEEIKKESSDKTEKKIEKPILTEKSKSDKPITTTPISSSLNKTISPEKKDKPVGETQSSASSNKNKMEIEGEKSLIKLKPMGAVPERSASQTSIPKKSTETVKTKPFEPSNIEKNHEDTLSGLLEDILSMGTKTQEESNDGFGQLPERSNGIESEENSSRMIEKAEESNKTPKGSSSNKITFASKSAEKEREDKSKKEKLSEDKKPKAKSTADDDEDDEDEQYYKSPPQKEEASSKIRFDFVAIKKDFDTYKRNKVKKNI